jgi:hypothetical protein
VVVNVGPALAAQANCSTSGPESPIPQFANAFDDVQTKTGTIVDCMERRVAPGGATILSLTRLENYWNADNLRRNAQPDHCVYDF